MQVDLSTKYSSAGIRSEFLRSGYLFPIDILNEDEVDAVRQRFDEIEREVGREKSQVGLQHLHRTEPMVWNLATHPRVIDTVRAVLGDDLLLLGSHFFCKQPDVIEPGTSGGFVAWHQDVTYWGLEPSKAVTIWLAVDDADVENGCMRYIPESHKGGQLPHGTSDRNGNLLSVNQSIAADLVDESQAVNVALHAGQAAMHDGLLIHGSNPNHSSRRRCGLTLRYTSTDVRPTSQDRAAQWKPTLIHGANTFGHFVCEPRPEFA